MTKATKLPNKAGKPLLAVMSKGETPESATARLLLRPTVNAAMTVRDYKILATGNAEVDLADLADELQKQCEAAERGELGRAETMLMSQAHSLDMIFTHLARRAFMNMGEYIESADRYMRLALKAQSQCRATLETLSAIKNPPVVIAKQANVTSGPQQVNNGIPLARENTIEPNKLLEQSNEQRLDGSAASQASGGDQAMAAVGPLDGAKDKNRQGA